MRPRPLISALGLAAVAALSLGAAPAAPAAPTAPTAGGGDDRLHPDVVRAYQATKKYRDESLALRDGYVPEPVCASSEEGGMGYHYVKEDHIGSTDPTRPAALLYEEKDGKRKLVAVEYLVVDEDQDLNTDEDRPEMFGGVPFLGPMPGHTPDMPIHYDLHAWLHKPNPNGLFAEWNPLVKCPEQQS
ncbi:hypothetical protein AB0A69_29400 [Streptomyces sp. NPDC045431]|uniref:hypothetical protein n=1 Tax=Streptomyces sp. NPDC045431 TaxID=3155613 RepID=UPI0033ED630F